MPYIILLLIGLFTLNTGIAQDPSRASVQVDYQNGYWVMDFHAGSAETHRALQAHYKDKDLGKVDINEYNTLFLKYLLSRIEVVMDSQKVVFKQVSFGTNSAEATAKLLSPRFNEPQKVIEAHITALKENEGHVTTVNFYDGNVVRQQALSTQNDFRAVLSFED